MNDNLDTNDIVQFLNSDDHKLLNQQLSTMKKIIEEDEQVLDYFTSVCGDCTSTESLMQYFEALYYEQKIRVREKKSAIKKFETCYDQKNSYLKNIEEQIKKLNHEVKLFKHLNEIKNQRHSGLYNKKEALAKQDDSEIYDWIVDIDLLTKVAKEGWEVKFSKNFIESSSMNMKMHIMGDRAIEPTSKSGDSDEKKFSCWQGAILSVVGLYDKGKTFVLNNISNSN